MWLWVCGAVVYAGMGVAVQWFLTGFGGKRTARAIWEDTTLITLWPAVLVLLLCQYALDAADQSRSGEED